MMLLAGASPTQTSWIKSRSLAPGAAQATAYDRARQRVVLFEARGAGASANTWEWDGATWIRRTPANSPSPRSWFAMAFDAARRRVVLFGGLGAGSTPLGDTWEWDGDTWTMRAAPVQGLARHQHAMTYDATRQRVVMFGGQSRRRGTRYFYYRNDTLEWDGNTWSQRAGRVSPQERARHAMTYDRARRRIVLFGGEKNGRHFDDTWEWDGNAWLPRVAARRPPAREFHAMAYDEARRRVLLFGGGVSSNRMGDTWEWDGAAWVVRSPPRSPSARTGHDMSYDSARRRIVLHGGFGSRPGNRTPQGLSDTWEWDGARWLQRGAPTTVSANVFPAVASDAARQRVVLFGGAAASVGFSGTETWEWDGSAWTRSSPAVSPPARNQHAMAYDAARRRILLFGGSDARRRLNDTWEWDGRTWARRAPTVSPPARVNHAMATDTRRRRVVLFGGTLALADTWEWDGGTWIRRTPATSPPGRAWHAMAYDEARRRVVLFGGNATTGALADTWEWDGRTWTRRSPATSPSARMDHGLAYDASRRRVVLFGGWLPPFQRFGDTWEWDGNNWTWRATSASPPVGPAGAMAYDAVRQRVVLPRQGSSDTWLYGGVVRAAARRFGRPCAGATGPPRITAGIPFLGNRGLVIDLLRARGSSACAFALAGSTRSLSLGGGCTLYVSGAIVPLVTTTNASGFASVKLPIPLDQGLFGGVAYAQGVVLDPMGAFAGLSFSAGLKLVVGD